MDLIYNNQNRNCFTFIVIRNKNSVEDECPRTIYILNLLFQDPEQEFCKLWQELRT